MRAIPNTGFPEQAHAKKRHFAANVIWLSAVCNNHDVYVDSIIVRDVGQSRRIG